MSMTTFRLARASTAPQPVFGWTATVTASWALAGGTAGGMLGAALMLLGRMHPDGLLLLSGFFAGTGSILGTVHGAVLGHLGHPTPRTADTGYPWIAALVAAILGFASAMLISVLLAVSATLVRAGSPIGWLGITIASVFAIAALGWATVLGWHALENAYHRWPDHRLGSWLVLGAFVVLLAATLALRPAVPGTELQLSTLGCILVAALAAVWVAAPAVIVGLRLVHRAAGARYSGAGGR